MVDLGLITGYILVGLCAVAAIVMPLIQSLSDPKSLAKSGVGVGVLLVIFLITYAMADGSAEGTTSGTSKMVGAGLLTMYVFVFIALAGIIYTEISKILK